MRAKTAEIKKSADRLRGSPRVFAVSDRVLVRSVRGQLVNWWPGEVTCVKSSSTYLVYVRNKVRFVHADHLRPSDIEPTAQQDPPPEVELPHASDITNATSTTNQSSDSSSPTRLSLPENREQPVPLRRSTRQRRPPERLTYDSF
ncbi:hypothetical protein MRX96_015415 [Rhipicephalus microplus]